MNPFVAEIRIFPFNFAPNGWAKCDGQLLPISQNTALFSLLGTTYGGNGQTTFSLPNLQDSSPNSFGQGPGLSNYSLGQQGGSQTISLLQSEIPAHTHTMNCNNGNGTSPSPAAAAFAGPAPEADRATLFLYSAATSGATTSMAPLSVTGGSLPHNNMVPFLTLNFCIAMQGVFPPRS
jgi:microcystin-dependent protein